ncbi:MAG TPA: hypothetical protein VHL34_24920 [Rhizomicrobium sp.]|nr:hypothetical protein [Rhizomicrobium sp.]
MTLPCVTARTAAGGKLYAAIAVNATGGRKGVVAHSREVASLAPFSNIDDATDELLRLTGGAEPTGLEL